MEVASHPWRSAVASFLVAYCYRNQIYTACDGTVELNYGSLTDFTFTLYPPLACRP